MSFSTFLLAETHLVKELLNEAKVFAKTAFSLIKTGPLNLPQNKEIPYAIVLFYSKDDNCWVADVPDLRFCSAFGDTPEAAAKEIQVALAGWIDGAKKKKRPLPPANFDPKHMNFHTPISEPAEHIFAS
jgi:predicted RNase H-like HicB family nuclease